MVRFSCLLGVNLLERTTFQTNLPKRASRSFAIFDCLPAWSFLFSTMRPIVFAKNPFAVFSSSSSELYSSATGIFSGITILVIPLLSPSLPYKSLSSSESYSS